MVRLRLPLFGALALALMACGERRQETSREALAPPPVLKSWPLGSGKAAATVRVSQQQIEAAQAIGVPPAFRDARGLTFVYIPPGSFRMGRPEDENEHTVHIDRGFYMQVGLVSWHHFRREDLPARYHAILDRARAWKKKQKGARVTGGARSVEYAEALQVADMLSPKGGGHVYRLPTEAEWAYACRAGTSTPYWWGTRPLSEAEHERYDLNPWGLASILTSNHAEWCSDRFDDLPSWERSDPTGPTEGHRHVLRGGGTATTRTGTPEIGYPFGHKPGMRLVAPVGYGLGAYGSVQVTFRLVDDEGADAANRDYDLRVISMNDRLAARTQGVDAVWKRVAKPTLPITLSMVPGSYYVYAEGRRDGKLVRGTEMKFHAKGDAVDQIVRVPAEDLKRFGSGAHSEPK